MFAIHGHIELENTLSCRKQLDSNQIDGLDIVVVIATVIRDSECSQQAPVKKACKTSG
jgi:hypothetical protein